MRIGGFVPDSLVDWEGKVVSVVFTKGCNLRCGYCHNPYLVLPDLLRKTEDIPVEEVFSTLQERKGWIDGVVVTGGEPTIHVDLPDFLSVIKETGLPVKLDTNGSNPTLIKCLIENRLIDFVAMDIKTVIEDFEYALVTGCHDPGLTGRIKESIELLRSSGIHYQFRTTVIPGLHNEKVIDKLIKDFSKDSYVLQQYRKGLTIDNFK